MKRRPSSRYTVQQLDLLEAEEMEECRNFLLGGPATSIPEQQALGACCPAHLLLHYHLPIGDDPVKRVAQWRSITQCECLQKRLSCTVQGVKKARKVSKLYSFGKLSGCYASRGIAKSDQDTCTLRPH
jgi:hypothetical protein